MTRARFRDYSQPVANEHGIITNCHFCKTRGKTQVCNALDDFYNADSGDTSNLCGKCPFFKTERQFWDDFHNIH